MMETQLFHIFRNTPLGRETLLQSIFFCNMTGSSLTIYIPEFTKFLMYFDNQVVQVDLDSSYLSYPQTALEHAKKLAEDGDIEPGFLVPKNFTASTLPDIPVNFDFLCCPRSISDITSKIGIGHIGSKVRRIIKTAPFPVIITSPAYREWNRITVFFGGSANAVKALKLGIRLARNTDMPLEVFTQIEGKTTKQHCDEIIQKENITKNIEKYVEKWNYFEKGSFEENLYEVSPDAIVVMGAFGHGLIKDIFFGSKMEKIQSTLTNNLLIAGPNYSAK